MLEFDYIKSLLCERGREDEKRHRNLEKYNYAEPVRAFVYYPVASLLCRTGVGGWIYILGFFFGMGGSVTVAYKFYLSTVKHQKKEEKKKKQKVSFNRHI